MYRRLFTLLSFSALSLSTQLKAADGHDFSRTPEEIRITLKRAIEAIADEYGDAYPADQYLQELESLPADDLAAHQALQRKALLANPTLDFDDILLIRRHFGAKARTVISSKIGARKGNFNSITQTERTGWDTSLVLLRDAFKDGSRRHVDRRFCNARSGQSCDRNSGGRRGRRGYG